MSSIVRICALFLTLQIPFSFAAYGADTIQDPITKVSFPATVSFEREGNKYDLEATGVATRSKFFVKIYSVAHYMQDPVTGDKQFVLEEILKDGKAKQVTYEWVRDVDKKRIQDTWIEGFQKSFSKEQMEQNKAAIDMFLGFLSQEAHAGDIHTLRWLPGGYIEMEINGEIMGSVKNEDVARAIWKFWFGPKSVVNRDKLMSKITTN